MKNKMVLASFLLGANIIIGSYCICNEKCVHNHAASSNDCISYNTYGENVHTTSIFSFIMNGIILAMILFSGNNFKNISSKEINLFVNLLLIIQKRT